MAYEFDLDDVGYLRSRHGEKALSSAAELALTPATLIADIAELKRRYPGHEAALAETTRLRRRAVGRLPGADEVLTTDDALQQASAWPVATHRAARIAAQVPDATVHDVTCSIGADLIAAASTTGISGVIGSDLDPVRLAMAVHNAERAEESARSAGRRRLTPVLVARADALTPTSRAEVVFADPARRSGGRRTFRLEDLVPPLPELMVTYADRRLVVKCAPGLDYQLLRNRFGFEGDVEIVSLDGGVREATLWSGFSTDGPGVTRATVLRSGGGSFTIDDTEPDTCTVGEAGRWILDPDGAVIRAGLVRQFATRHQLWQLDAHIAYLTGDDLPAGERGWPVIERLPFTEKKIRRALAEHDCGVLEITVRGVDVDPDALRKRLRLKGHNSMALVITRIGSVSTAFLCGAGVRAPLSEGGVSATE